ncbi:MAG: DUF1015 domain-containing protein [Dehalococcoidia bacterium]|nr:DUF1015 domain-containing protein [Dehalococcoidia bacterium]MDW8119223.1 DUF1015 domain-containing protein [Chloroflexota bacterium]
MVDVRPFQGLRYRPSAVDDLSRVISPPYDVVRVDQRGVLYQRSPYNIIRLEYGLIFPDDTPEDNVYTRAASLYRRWLSEGVLGRESSPALYVLQEVFPYGGRQRTRRGLLGAVRLEPYERRVVFPHEHTSPGPKQDRLRLLQATQASFSPILALYRPNNRVQQILDEVTATAPEVEAQGWDATTYRLWVVTDRVLQRALRTTLENQPVYLADGHHRYETALAYEAMCQASTSSHPDDAFHFVPMCLVSMDDPGLVVEAFHRLVGPLTDEERRSLQMHQERMFTPSEASWPLTLDTVRAILDSMPGGDVAIACADREEGRIRLLHLRPGVLTDRAPHPALLKCDTWVLHEGLLRPALGKEDALPQGKVTFVHSLEEVWHHLNRGEASLAYLLRPIPWAVFVAVVEAGLRLPPKSTYFYPKLPAGLVIYPVVGRLPPP